jgi:FAD synthetase
MPTSSLAGVSSDELGNTPTISQSNPPSLPVICAQVYDRLETFLTTEPKTARIRAVQEQSRLSLRIIEEALEKYR